MGIKELVTDLLESSNVLRTLIHDDFTAYLDGRSEIPREDFVLKLVEGDNTPATLIARIILGRIQDSDKPRNVTPKFREFVGRYKPLEVEILRYFTPIESRVTKLDSFYGNPSNYKKVDITS